MPKHCIVVKNEDGDIISVIGPLTHLECDVEMASLSRGAQGAVTERHYLVDSDTFWVRLEDEEA